MPHPCSPVIVPPSATDSSRISAPKASAVLVAGLVGVEQDQRVQVAVAGVEDVMQRMAYLLSICLDRLGISPRRLRGMVPSMQ